MCPRLSIKSIYRVIYENHFTVTYNHFWSIKQFTPLNIYVFRERERSKHQSILPRCVDRLNKTEKAFSLKGCAVFKLRLSKRHSTFTNFSIKVWIF